MSGQLPLGGIASLLLLAPNIAWALVARSDTRASVGEVQSPLLRFLGTVEPLARVAAFVTPFLSGVFLGGILEQAAAVVFVLSLAIYYAGWLRYFARGRGDQWLYAPLWGLPVPMTIAPVACFAAASIVLHSIWVGIASFAFAVSHVPLSLHRAERGAAARATSHSGPPSVTGPGHRGTARSAVKTMRWLSRTLLVSAALLALVMLAGCAPGANPLAHQAAADRGSAGFLLGLWHGFIIWVTFFVSLFDHRVSVYEVYNAGWSYNLGFVIGAACLHGGGAKAARRRRRGDDG